ncbi:unnamed protein product [Symbiodinium necroappetens]|uniref:Uncharacterized protein n=1 Tax=Symbiodinium necroappetens TaxID=1628268 RepID=A0A812SSX2_9DINO|nr:unnamed protein product [Symbiodinium necroappetens]
MPLRGDVPDYMERWNNEWAKQLPLNALNQFVALAGRLATPGALGQLASALLSIFWPSGRSTRALVEFILQWTKDHVEKDYVAQELIKSFNGNVSADLDAVKVQMGIYQIGVENLRMEAMGAAVFPSDRFMSCLRALESGQFKGRDALHAIKLSPVKYGAIASYLLAFSSALTIVREGTMKVPGSIMNSTEVRNRMNRVYENCTATLQDIIAAFWEWRSEKIDFSMQKGALKWEDRLTRAKRKLGNNLQAKRDEVQDAAMLVLKRDIFVGELAPMRKSYTTLHRRLPGRSDDPPKRKPFFREMIYLGPYSSFIMGAVNTNAKEVGAYTHPDQRSGTSVTKIGNEQGLQTSDRAKRWYTGPGLCGLYTLHQFHKYTEPFSFTLGRGIELSFKWEPVTEEDF